MGEFVSIINLLLYSAWDWLDQILRAFGLSWAGLAVGFAVISVILRLFAANLVGTAVGIRDERRSTAAREARVARKQAQSVRKRGSSYSTSSGSDYSSYSNYF